MITSNIEYPNVFGYFMNLFYRVLTCILGLCQIIAICISCTVFMCTVWSHITILCIIPIILAGFIVFALLEFGVLNSKPCDRVLYGCGVTIALLSVLVIATCFFNALNISDVCGYTGVSLGVYTFFIFLLYGANLCYLFALLFRKDEDWNSKINQSIQV
jgi:hypothetical protein